MTEPISEDEARILVYQAVQAKGENGATEDEIQKLIEWAEAVRMDTALLNLTLEGMILAYYNSESKEMQFRKRSENEPFRTAQELSGPAPKEE